jgi:hypothetical protein
MSWRFHEAVLRVIVSPSWGPAFCHHGRSGYQPFSLVPNADGGGSLHSVSISQNYSSPLVELANTTSSLKGGTNRGIIVQARTAGDSNKGNSISKMNVQLAPLFPRIKTSTPVE